LSQIGDPGSEKGGGGKEGARGIESSLHWESFPTLGGKKVRVRESVVAVLTKGGTCIGIK